MYAEIMMYYEKPWLFANVKSLSASIILRLMLSSVSPIGITHNYNLTQVGRLRRRWRLYRIRRCLVPLKTTNVFLNTWGGLDNGDFLFFKMLKLFFYFFYFLLKDKLEGYFIIITASYLNRKNKKNRRSSSQ